MIGSTAAFGVAFAFVMPPNTALYWYAFPLFGIAVPYLVEVRRELTPRWWLTFGSAAVVSPIALAQDWAFSGHVLWNVLLLGHVASTPARSTAWLPLFGASLVHLFVLKATTQTGRDLAGGVFSAALAGGILAVGSLLRRRRLETRPIDVRRARNHATDGIERAHQPSKRKRSRRCDFAGDGHHPIDAELQLLVADALGRTGRRRRSGR